MDSQHMDNGHPARGLPPFILPVVTAIVALGAGTVVGGIVTWFAKPDQVVETQVPRELTTAELQGECSPLMAEMASNLDQAGEKVTDLVSQVREKESKVKELEAEMARRSERGAEIRKELATAKAELAEVKAQLETAIQEKEALVVELKKTVADLEQQKDDTRVAKEDSLSNEWQAFLNQAQLDVCEKGNRKKLGKCRDDVMTVLTAQREEFGHCVRSGQESPTLHEAAKDDVLPQFSAYLNEDDRIVKGWYVRMCDPTLPEAEGFGTTAVSADIEILD